MRLSVLIVLIVAAGLALFNPEMSDFEAFAQTHSEDLVTQQTGSSALGAALAGASSNIISAYLQQIAHRENYVLYSIYTVDLGSEIGEWKFLGVADQFIELERPDALRDR